jgi:hypothetical protein
MTKLSSLAATLNNGFHDALFRLLAYCDKNFAAGNNANRLESAKAQSRYDVINLLLSMKKGETAYLEIGVRNPQHCFQHIHATTKYGVDPACSPNNVAFPMTSDEFFKQLACRKILAPPGRFDVIFIDGLHLAEQVDRDIENALRYIKDDGFIVLHDCNPPTEWHARETEAVINPANGSWNGTVWKAFVKARQRKDVTSCCVDTDWGVGILTRQQYFSTLSPLAQQFYEYGTFNNNRKEWLNLIDFSSFSQIMAGRDVS